MNDLLASCWTIMGPVVPGSGDKSPWSIADRIESAADAGFTGIGIELSDLRTADLAKLKRTLDEHGITRVQLQLLTGWWGGTTSDHETLFAAASELGAFQIKARADDSAEPVPIDEMREGWIAVCDRARAVGAQVALEPLPFSNLRTIEAGAAFVQSMGHPNGGIIVDLWHLHRGGSTLPSVEVFINPVHLFGVELCDGRDPAPVGMALVDDSSNNRLLPGDGDWDVTNFLRTMTRLGYTGPWGVEICSTEFRQLSLVEAVGRASISARAALQRR